ncbi:MAG: cupin [Pelagibacterium sp. SCN 64-44]|nr:MAG: cupin [Pelagibacterium sp. SCN 64-44]
MRKISPIQFIGKRAWDAMGIETIEGLTTVRLHWADAPYQWHVNDGPEVFVVLDGEVNMHARSGNEVIIHNLRAGDIFHAEDGDEHLAHPVAAARVLVIEREGSV